MNLRGLNFIQLVFLPGALALALFFDGRNLETLISVVTLLLIAMLGGLLQGDRAGISVPRHALPVLLALYVGWLALTLLWSPVLHISLEMFWWMSVLPLAYWAMLLQPVPEQRWSYILTAVGVIGVILVGTGLYELLWREQSPQSTFFDINLHAPLLALMAVPLAGCYLALQTQPATRRFVVVLSGAALFVLVYGVLLAKGRDAIPPFLAGMAFVAVVAFRHVPQHALHGLIGILFGAYILADLTWHSLASESVSRLAELYTAVPDRWPVWEGAVRLLGQAPWFGIGLGLFAFRYAPERDPADVSAGLFAHNDYLQIWIESGLPGVALFAGAMLVAAVLAVRLLRRAEIPVAVRLEAAGLIGGLATTAVHGFIEYDFYILPIGLLFGLLLARLQILAAGAGLHGSWRWFPGPRLRAETYRAGVITLFLIPITPLVVTSVALSLNEYGIAQARRNDWNQAETLMRWARRLSLDSDELILKQANLYYGLASQTALAERTAFFEQARTRLDEVERINPWRVETFLMRAQLYQEHRERIGPAGDDAIDAAYRQALTLNPRHYVARFLYARFVMARGDLGRTQEILEEGTRYLYPDDDRIVPYLAFTAALRELTGDYGGALALYRRVGNYAVLRRGERSFDAEWKENRQLRESIQELLRRQR